MTEPEQRRHTDVVGGLIGLILAVPFTAVAFEAVKIARRPDEATNPQSTSKHVADPQASPNEAIPTGATS